MRSPIVWLISGGERNLFDEQNNLRYNTSKRKSIKSGGDPASAGRRTSSADPPGNRSELQSDKVPLLALQGEIQVTSFPVGEDIFNFEFLSRNS